MQHTSLLTIVLSKNRKFAFYIVYIIKMVLYKNEIGCLKLVFIKVIKQHIKSYTFWEESSVVAFSKIRHLTNLDLLGKFQSNHCLKCY